MSTKHLLVDTSQNQFARELLRSADLDEPPTHSAVRLAVALGLGSSALVSTLATGAAASTQAAVGAAVATAAKGVTAVGAAVPVAGTAVSANLAASTTVLTSAFGAAKVAGGTALLASAGGVSAATAPAVGGALSAVGMLKAMAIVSLTCGALSFGGTKLAMTITEASNPVASSSLRSQQAPAPQPKRIASRGAARAAPIDQLVTPPPAPELAPQDQIDNDDDEVLPALMQEPQQDSAPRTATERNVGRQVIGEAALRANDVPGNPRDPAISTEHAGAPGSDPVRRAAVAAFPSDEEPAAPALNAQPEKRPKARLRTRKVEPEVDKERELLLLDRARMAVAAGQPLVALQALDAYRTQAHRGTQRAESLVLRVKALLALGQRSAAEREALPFIKAAPESGHAARLRELLGVPNDTP